MDNEFWDGYKGPINAAAGAVTPNYVMVHMFAAVASGQATPEEAAREAERRAQRLLQVAELSRSGRQGLMRSTAAAGMDLASGRRPSCAHPAVRQQAVPGLPLHAAGGRAAAGVPDLPARASASGWPSPTPRSAAAATGSGSRTSVILLDDRVFATRSGQHVFYTVVATRREIRARAVAGAAAERAPAVQVAAARRSSCCPGSCRRCCRRSPSGGSTTRSSPSSPICWSIVLGWRDHLYRLPRHAVERALVADRGQYLARHPVRRDHAAGRAADHLALALRGGAARRRQRLAALPLHHACRC